MQFEQLGPYRIVRQLGKGGMGTVYAAVEPTTRDAVAVKVLSAALGREEGFRERFAAEIDSLRKLRHPNIVRILGYGEEDGHRFYAMELVVGRSLEVALQVGRRFQFSEVIDIAVQTCRALRHAHDRGIIHRDIKPANLLLAADNSIKLSDFGIAKLFGNAGMTADGGVLGTAEYMAPEQADGRPVSYRCDLYSLGGVMYTLLAGRPPFRATSLLEMLQLQRFAEPEPLRRYAPETPPELEEVVLTLLSKEPEQRIPNALVLSRRLEAMAHGLAARQARGGDRSSVPPVGETAEAESGEAAAGAASPAVAPASDVCLVDSHQVTHCDDNDVAGDVRNSARVLPPAAAVADLGAPGDSVLELAGRAAPAFERPSTNITLDMPADEASVPKSTRSPTATGVRKFVPVDADEDLRLEMIDDEGASAWISPQTWVLIGALLSMGLVAWWWMQPPSADALYRRIQSLANEDRIERLVEAEPLIQSFFRHHPSDPRGRDLAAYQDEIELYRLDRKFEFRARRMLKREGLTPIERAYFEAINEMQVDVASATRKLQALVALYGGEADRSNVVRDCVRLAQKQLERLERQVSEFSSDDVALLTRQLEQIDKFLATDPDEGRRRLAAIIVLYSGKPWTAALVETARQKLAELGPVAALAPADNAAPLVPADPSATTLDASSAHDPQQ